MLQAQDLDPARSNNNGSPYSRFGLGDLFPNNLAYNRAMAGLTIAIQDSTQINFDNPAALGALQWTTYNFAVSGKRFQLSNSETSLNKTNANLAYFAMAFPMRKNWGMSFGLMPYSNINYQVVSETTVNNITREQRFIGSGGINRIFLSNGFKINKNLYLGGNASFLFGKINQSQFIEVKDSASTFYDLHFSDQTNLNDFIFSLALQYQIPFKIKNPNDTVKGNFGIRIKPLPDSLSLNKRKSFRFKPVKLTLGAKTDFARKLNAENNFVVERFVRAGSQVGIIDSVQGLNPRKQSGSLNLPASYGVGIAFETNIVKLKRPKVKTEESSKVSVIKKEHKLFLATDLSYQDWTTFESFGRNDSLNQSFTLAFGGYYQPKLIEKASLDEYWKIVRYRFGARYTRSYLKFGNENIDELGITFGLSLPILGARFSKEKLSKLDIALELGRRGNTQNGLIQENYGKITIGLSLTDRWFIKRKYD